MLYHQYIVLRIKYSNINLGGFKIQQVQVVFVEKQEQLVFLALVV